MLSVAFKTITYKEIRRFLAVYNQTLIAPVVNSMLFFAIFTVVFKHAGNALDYKSFVASGLIMMAILQNAYSNTQSTMTMAKVLGFSVDTQMPPISTFTLLSGFLAGGVVRGMLVGIFSIAVFCFFAPFSFKNPGIAFIYAVLASILFAMIGIMVGATSKTFDSSVSYNTYIITPITMLSGTFYSIKMLPVIWQKIILFNPVFYIIEGFRFGMTGFSESPFDFFRPILILIMWICILFVPTYYLLKNKYYEIR